MKLTTISKSLLVSASFLLVACDNTDQQEPQQDIDNEEPSDSLSEKDEGVDVEEEQRVEENENEDENSTISNEQDDTENDQNDTLATMSEEQRHEHYRTLIVDPDENLDEKVFEYLELSGVHENTSAYGGRVNPDSKLEIEVENRRLGFESSDEIKVNPDGFFAINLHQYDSIEGDELKLSINHAEIDVVQQFVLPVHGVEDGMEIIEPLTDTSEFEDNLLDTLNLNNFPDIYPTTLNFGSSLGRHLEGFMYSLNGTFKGNAFMQYSQRDNDEGDFIVRLDESPETGQIFRFYAIGDGIIASKEIEVQEMTSEAAEAAERIRNETGLSLDSTTEGETSFETIPNAKISIYNADMERAIDLYSDENGEFVFPSPENYNEEGTTLFFTIRDEAGYTETIELDID